MTPREQRMADLAQQASLDDNVRTLLQREGIEPSSDVKKTVEGLRELDASSFNRLVSSYQEMEQQSPDTVRRAEILQGVNQQVSQLWDERTQPMIADADVVLNDQVKQAKSSLQNGNIAEFEASHKSISDAVHDIGRGLRTERTQLSDMVRGTLSQHGDLFSQDDIRKVVQDQNDTNMQTPQRLMEVAAAPQTLSEARQAYQQAADRAPGATATDPTT